MELKETQIEITTNGDFRNIYPKKQLETEQYINIEKMFEFGLEKEGKYGKYYIIKAKYNEEEVSFFLNPKEHQALSDIGGIGDLIKMYLYKEEVKVKAGDLLVSRLGFQLA